MPPLPQTEKVDDMSDEIKITIDDILQSDAGFDIVQRLLPQVISERLHAMFQTDVIKQNICHYIVMKYIGTSLERFALEIEQRVKDAIEKPSFLEHFEYNKDVLFQVSNLVRENHDIIAKKVLAKLDDDETYHNLQYSIGSNVVDAIRKGLEK